MSEQRAEVAGRETSEYQAMKRGGIWAIVGVVLGAIVVVGPELLAGQDQSESWVIIAGAAIAVVSIVYKALLELGYIKARTELKKRSINLAKMLLLCLGLSMLAGCSYYSSNFVDADGTKFKSLLLVAPFGKLQGQDAQMRYTWTGQGGGEIGVGQNSQGFDQTGQLDAVRDLVAALSNLAAGGAANDK
jgi:hypothetical protein